MRAGIQEGQVKLDTVRVRGLEWMGGFELRTYRRFPLLGGHEGVVKGWVRAEVKWSLLVGDGSTQVRGI